MKEIWKLIPGYEKYEVSNLGRVRSHKRKETIILRQTIEKNRPQIELWKDNKSKLYPIYKLMAMAFLNHKPCGHKIVIDHIDNNPLNNHLSNLQLISQRKNSTKDRWRKKTSSKYLGVYFNSKQNRFIASIQIKGIDIHLIQTEDEDYAGAMYKTASENLSLFKGTRENIKEFRATIKQIMKQ